jgi:hypothetical protein
MAETTARDAKLVQFLQEAGAPTSGPCCSGQAVRADIRSWRPEIDFDFLAYGGET